MKKRYIFATILFLILIIVVGGILCIGKLYESNRQKVEALDTNVISECVMPDIQVYYGDYEINSMSGYTMNMDVAYMRDSLTPVNSKGKVKIKINTNGSEIKKISYELRDIEDGRLIDNAQVSEWNVKNGTISLKLDITNIIKENTEYMICINLSTKDYDNISYYTRVIYLPDETVTAQLEFLMGFSDATFDYEKAKDYVAYLETDNNADNDNLGIVSINSNFDQLTWGELSPEKITDNSIVVKEIQADDNTGGQAGSYELSYKVKTVDGDGKETLYYVVENYVVWTYMGTNYLLDYYRTVDEEFVADGDAITKSGINLGIQSEEKITVIESEDKTKAAFVISDALYYVDLTDGAVVKVYELGQQMHGKSDIQEIAINDDGNLEFIVYGYMGNGEHAGKNGISAFTYDAEKNISNEILFIPYDKPYDVLEQEIGELYYISDEVLYILVESSLNYINLVTKECGQSIVGLEKGSYAINGKRNLFAYNTNGSVYESDSITIVNFDTGNQKVIEAGDGFKIRVCGFINDDLVYGIAKEKNIEIKKNGNSMFNMSNLYIMNSEYEIIKTYSQKKVLITDVEITETIINLERVKNGEVITDDQILYNTEKGTGAAELTAKNYDSKKKQIVISFLVTQSSMSSPKIKDVKEVKVSSLNELDVNIPDSEEMVYIVYGRGKIAGVYGNYKKAKSLAEDISGVVVNETGKKVFCFLETYNN
ncbi:MAG: hypothetical protein ACI4DS_03250 [Eubacterium sp.]